VKREEKRRNGSLAYLLGCRFAVSGSKGAVRVEDFM